MGIPYWVGFTLGILSVFVFLWLIALGRILVFFPFPCCRQGSCRDLGDYSWVVGTIYGRQGWGTYHYTCRCGHHYVRQGRKFMEALTGQVTRPYKRLTAFRRWDDDTVPRPDAS